MLYNVTLYARAAGPGRLMILAVVDMFPSRVMVVLTGLYDCMTKIVIPDPKIMAGEKRFGLAGKSTRL
jgi:hypothetical protein